MSKSFIIFMLFLPAGLFAQTEKIIEIGGFNIEWFPCKDNGKMMREYGINMRDMPDGAATDTIALMNLLKDLDIELLGVVEIVDPELLERLAQRHLGSQFKLIYAPSNSSQEVGFLYDSSVLLVVGKPQIYQEVALSPDSWLRPALRVYFKTISDGFDFHAVVVHLKAAPSGWEQRKKQWKVLEKILSNLPAETKDGDIVLVGDFNNVSQNGYDEFNPLLKRINFTWASAELADAHRFSNYWQPDHGVQKIEGSLIDHIFISNDAREEFIENSVKTGGMCADGKSEYADEAIPAYYETISDHCPVFGSFRADKDND